MQALYDRLIKESGAGQRIPTFEALQLDVSADAREAARFILDLLAAR